MSANSTTTTTAESTQPDVRFPLGRTFITRGALDALAESQQSASEFLVRHQRGIGARSALRTHARMNTPSRMGFAF